MSEKNNVVFALLRYHLFQKSSPNARLSVPPWCIPVSV